MDIITILILSLFTLNNIQRSPVAADDQIDQFCDDTGNYTTNSTYQSNLNSLLSTLTSNNASVSGFAKATVGQIPNQVNGLVLCRGDTNATECKNCLATASQDAPKLCPLNVGAAVFYENCLLIYSNQYFISSFDNLDEFYSWKTDNVTDYEKFNQLLSELLSATADYAAYNSTRKFATGAIGNFSDENPTIYALVQCTPDMAGSQCRSCVQDSFKLIKTTQMNGSIGGSVVGVRCNFQYGVDKFFEGDPTLTLTQSSAKSPAFAPSASLVPSAFSNGGSSGKKKQRGAVLAVAITLGVAALLSISAFFICFLKKRKSKLAYGLDDMASFESLLYNASTIRAATCDFSDENKLGQGGFGAVYKMGVKSQ